MATALRKPVGHEDRLSLVEHLDELRSRLIICVITVGVIFSLCAWQNGRLLDIINHPLDKETQKNVVKGRGPLGQIERTRQAVLGSGQAQLAALRAPQRARSLSPPPRRSLAADQALLERSLARLPSHVA